MADDAVDMNVERIRDETRYVITLISPYNNYGVWYANSLSLSRTQFDMSDKRRSGDICSANWTEVRP